MKFGIHIGHMGGPLDEMRKLWKFADANGFDWFSVSDHFQESPPRGGDSWKWSDTENQSKPFASANFHSLRISPIGPPMCPMWIPNFIGRLPRGFRSRIGADGAVSVPRRAREASHGAPAGGNRMTPVTEATGDAGAITNGRSALQ